MPFKKGHKINVGKKFHLGFKHSDEVKLKMSLARKGKKTGRSWNKGKVTPQEVRIKMSEAHKGEKSYLWKGGITPINEAIRKSVEYRLWREAVFKRDNYTCVWCGQRGGKLNADHIKPFALFPELRFALDNGRTLCKSCHMTTDTYGRPTSKMLNFL